jgi:hypothetical protein
MLSNPNLKPSDRNALLGVVNPQSATTAKSTGWVNAGLFESLLAVVKAGAITATGTVDAKLEQATSSAGAGAKDITGKAITQLTAAGTDDNKQALINCQSEDLDVANGFAFARLTITPATAAALIDGELWGLDARYPPGTQATTVDEVVG